MSPDPNTPNGSKKVLFLDFRPQSRYQLDTWSLSLTPAFEFRLQGLGFRVLGFRGLGFGVLGFRGLGFRVLGFRV